MYMTRGMICQRLMSYSGDRISALYIQRDMEQGIACRQNGTAVLDESQSYEVVTGDSE